MKTRIKNKHYKCCYVSKQKINCLNKTKYSDVVEK